MEIRVLDLKFQETEGLIGSFLLRGGGSVALIEAGPTSCMEHLMQGLLDNGVPPEAVEQVLLTHIHLDHAGAAGALATALPNAMFYAHETGVPHLVDPSRLIKSASRIYGEKMAQLWGEILPLSQERLIPLKGEEELQVAGGVLVTHYTPGHARHHVSYYEPEEGILFAGDMAGVRLAGASYVRPPTPPPELDLELWSKSIGDVRELAPRKLMLTHFGGFTDVESHLRELEQRLFSWRGFVEERAAKGLSGPEITAELREYGDEELARTGATPEQVEQYEASSNYEMTVNGYLRYLAHSSPA